VHVRGRPDGAAQRLAAVQGLLQRPRAESRLLLDRIERFTDRLTASERGAARGRAGARAHRRTTSARDRYLAFARDADQP
jgi:hypothetical protein